MRESSECLQHRACTLKSRDMGVHLVIACLASILLVPHNFELKNAKAFLFFEISTSGFLQCLHKSILFGRYIGFFKIRPHKLVKLLMFTRS